MSSTRFSCDFAVAIFTGRVKVRRNPNAELRTKRTENCSFNNRIGKIEIIRAATAACLFAWNVLAGVSIAAAQSYSPPAGVRPVSKTLDAAILPGGRVVAPLGKQYPTGAGAFSLAASPSGKSLISVNLGPAPPSLTVLEGENSWTARQLRLPESREPDAAVAISTGIAFFGERAALVSEGASGQVASIDLTTGDPRRAIDLNQNGSSNSFAGDLALDAQRDTLYVADPANLRVVVADARSRRILASLSVDNFPAALALSPDARILYIVEPAAPGKSGSASIAVADVSDPAHPKLETSIPATADPSAILAVGDRVYVANTGADSITVIGARSRRVEMEIPLRIPGLDSLRGIWPSSLAFHQKSGWLLVAEAGINAIGVIDAGSGKVLGHLPAGWYPTRVLVSRDTVFVANARGEGAGPRPQEGSLSVYTLPPASALAGYTDFVLHSCGFAPRPQAPPPLSDTIRYAVLIVKGSRSFDEVLGDLTQARNGSAMGAPVLAHLGSQGYADGARKRLSLQQVNITPNQHAIAAQWTFSDNFYADSFGEAEGHLWLAGDFPNPRIESSLLSAFPRKEPVSDPGTIWQDFTQHGISFQRFGDPPDPPISDTGRASRFIAQIDERFVKPGADLPRFLYILLPNDSISQAQPERGYLYPESAAVDNDNAVGLILEYLSKTPWWKQMAVFITEASGGTIDRATGVAVDHLETHRTALLCAGPWVKRNFVSHTNTGFPGLLKTILEIFRLPALNLFDASAADLSDCFTTTPDYTPYRALPVDTRIYDPGK
jgi:DNA-binding beta-propeller fold protein YncE